MSLSRQQRDKMIAALKTIWTARDIPFIDDAVLTRLTPESLTDLAQFWAFQNRHWVNEGDDDSNAPIYRGASIVAATATPKPAHNPTGKLFPPRLPGRTCVGGLSNFASFGQARSVAFYSTGGGKMTQRQLAAKVQTD